MKKTLSILLALAMLLSTASVCFAEEKKVELKNCETDARVTDTGVNIMEDQYIKVSAVKLDGIKSVTITASCVMPFGQNGDAVAVKTDDPVSGDAIGYVIINNEDKTEFSANLLPTTGTHDVYLVSEYAKEHSVSLQTITFSENEVVAEKSAVDDSKIKDNYSDTWAATDSLGRKVADYAEAGAVKSGDRYVGTMYWNWHVNTSFTPRVIPKIVEENPDTWQHGGPHWPSSSVYYWGEPILGYYSSFEYWTYIKHATWLANAGVDAIFLDYTNSDTEYIKSLGYLIDAFHQAREYGINVPKIITYGPTGLPAHRRLQEFPRHFGLTIIRTNLIPTFGFTWTESPL